MVADERRDQAAGAAACRPARSARDMCALFRIVDRAMGTFLRVRVLLGDRRRRSSSGSGSRSREELGSRPVPVRGHGGACCWAPCSSSRSSGSSSASSRSCSSSRSAGPAGAVDVLVVYIVAVQVGLELVETRRLARRPRRPPGLLMIPAIVVLSQFGVIWLLAAAPDRRDPARHRPLRHGPPRRPAGPGQCAARGAA